MCTMTFAAKKQNSEFAVWSKPPKMIFVQQILYTHATH